MHILYDYSYYEIYIIIHISSKHNM